MRVLLLNQYFWPETVASPLMTDLAEDLAAAGVRVSVITSRHSYSGRELYDASEHWRGVNIVRIPTTRFGRDHLAGRAVDDASFLAVAGVRLLAGLKADVVITASAPPFLSALGALHRRIHGSKYVYWVHDLFPDAGVELGLLPRRGTLHRGLEALSHATLRSSDAIVAIGHCMAERIAAKGIARDRIEVLQNWADGEVIHPVAHEDNWFRRQQNLGDKFVVLYSGNMGRGHSFDAVIAAARALRHDPRIVFLFIGGGPRRPEIERSTAGLQNVRFLPYQPREHLAHTIGAADLGVVTLRDEALGTMVPSKLYAYMAAGRPVLYVGPASAQTGRTVRQAACGASFPCHDVSGATAWIDSLVRDPTRARALGDAARHGFERDFTRSRATNRFLHLCRAVAARPTRPDRGPRPDSL